MADLYVYYRLEDTRDVGQWQQQIGRLFAEVVQKFGMQARLQRKQADPATWMEIYPNVMHQAELLAFISVFFADDTLPERHMEWFEDLRA